MGEITQEALNIMLQDGKTKDNLKQVLSGVLENVASRAISEQIKALYLLFKKLPIIPLLLI